MIHLQPQGRARTEGWARSARPVGAVRALPGSQAPRAKKNKLAGQVTAGQVEND